MDGKWEPDLETVLEQSRALANRNRPGERLDRTLDQIDEESRQLPQGEPGAPEASTLRLLASYGSAPTALERKLHASALLDSLTPIPEPDLPSLVAHHDEMTVLAAIRSTLESTKAESLARITMANEAKWNGEKHALLSVGPAAGRRDWISREESSVMKNGSTMKVVKESPFLREVLRPSPYVEVVREVLEARGSSQKRRVPIATRFRECVMGGVGDGRGGGGVSVDARRRRIGNLFMAMSFLAEEPGVLVLPGKFPMAVAYLASQMREKVLADIAANPIEAARGGVPGTVGDVRAWLSIMFARGMPEGLELYKGVPLWAQIWYCMRLGDMSAALEISKGAAVARGYEDGFGMFVECLDQFSRGQGIGPENEEKLVQEFILSAARSNDPYRRACCVLVAGGERDRLRLRDEDYNLLFGCIEDYLFLRLAAITGDRRDSEGLREVQEEMERFGPGHFDPDGNMSSFYALILVLVGLVGKAVKYLETAGDLETASHVALVDRYYNGDTRLATKEFASILWKYVSTFMHQHETDAALYLFTIAEGAVRDPYLKKLLLGTKSFGKLLGESSRFGSITSTSGVKRRIGVFEALWPLTFRPVSGADKAEVHSDWRDLVGAAARDAEQAGDREGAIRCYEAAGEEINVVRMLTEAVLAQMSLKNSKTRTLAVENARMYVGSYFHTVSPSVVSGQQSVGKAVEDLRMVVSLSEFFDKLFNKQYAAAWEVLERVNVLPLDETQLVGKVSDARYGVLGERLEEVLLAAVECLTALYKKSGKKSYKDQMKMLVNFAGMVGSNVDISARLVQLEVLML